MIANRGLPRRPPPADRRRLAVNNLVAKLDLDLVLSAEQRDRLCESLASHWNDAWCRSMQGLMNIDQCFPSIPDEYVLPILSDARKEAWRDVPKNQAVFWGGFAMFAGMMPEDLTAGGEKPAEARKADPEE